MVPSPLVGIFKSNKMKSLTQAASEIQVSYYPKQVVGNKITCSGDAYSVLKDFYPIETIGLQERFVVAYLNRAHHVIDVYEASVGSMTSTIVDIRIILSIALKVAATNLILSHNHPSGNLIPSFLDKELTIKMKDASKLMDINVLDHIILNLDGKYFSFADEGILINQ